MTAKEYLRKAYRLDQQIDSHVAELEHLRELSTRIQGSNFGERVSSTRGTEASYTRIIDKIADMQQRINAEIDTLVDLRAELDAAIGRVSDVDERLLLRYRYINNDSWGDIAKALNVSSRTVHRIHSSALQNFVIPNEGWHSLP
jgi:DNA-directed RNA polymerase specialized sigma subunit